MATVGLAMIARDEARTITRALDSVRPLVDYVLVLDTGSTDGTRDIVSSWLDEHTVEGTVLEEPWRDFAWNRSLALAALRQTEAIDYALVLDADDVLEINPNLPAVKHGLNADCYTVEIRHGGIVHSRVQLVSNRKPFFYRGIVHEFLDCPEPFTTGHLDGIAIRVVGGGSRSRTVDVYREDARLLEAALVNGGEPGMEHRYTFYLAQSWRDCDETENALGVYLKRAELGGWVEEVYVSLLNAARLQERLERPLDEIVDSYQRAIAMLPARAEAIHGLARALRLADLFHEAYEVARKGVALPLHRGLFVEPWTYRFGVLDEYAVSAYWAGHYAECWIASELILQTDAVGGGLDQINRTRVRANADYARQKCLG